MNVRSRWRIATSTPAQHPSRRSLCWSNSTDLLVNGRYRSKHTQNGLVQIFAKAMDDLLHGLSLLGPRIEQQGPESGPFWFLGHFGSATFGSLAAIEGAQYGLARSLESIHLRPSQLLSPLFAWVPWEYRFWFIPFVKRVHG